MPSKLALTVFIEFVIMTPVFAEPKKIYTYCVSENKEWLWLKNESNDYIQLMGQIKTAIALSNDWVENYNFEFFEVQEENALEKIQYLQKLCQRNFGERFHIVQPAYNRLSPWMIFSFKHENEIYFTSGYFGNYYEIPPKITNPDRILRSYKLEYNKKAIIPCHEFFKTNSYIIDLNANNIK